MQITAVLTLLACTGSVLAAAPAAASSCTPGFFYGQQACQQNCAAGKCSIQKGHENDNDHVCICSNPKAKGCSGMYKGEKACEASCAGKCTLLLLPYDCKC